MRALPRAAEEWQGIVAAFRASGVGRDEFCQKHGIRPATFRNWLYGRRKQGSTGRNSFVRVEATPTSVSFDGVEVVLGNGLVLRCGQLPDPSYLAQLRRAVAAC